MTYIKTTWVNDQAPAINATNLNKIEAGIFDNDAAIANLGTVYLGLTAEATSVANGVYTIGDQSIAGIKTFTSSTVHGGLTNTEVAANKVQIDGYGIMGNRTGLPIYITNNDPTGSINFCVNGAHAVNNLVSIETAQTTFNHVLKVVSSGNTLDFGSLNTTWCHFNTTATSGFYFYDHITVNSDITATAFNGPLVGNADSASLLGTLSASQFLRSDATDTFTNLDGATVDCTGNIQAGVGSGAIGLTINDGYGNSNVTFNHTAGIPEQAGNIGRISVNTDATTGAEMVFGIKSNAGTSLVDTTDILTITESAITGTQDFSAPQLHSTVAEGTAPFTVVSTTKVTGLNADELDGISSGSFLRSDTADSKTSGDLTMYDNVAVNFGTGSDCELWHNGSNLYLDVNNGQNFYMRDGNSSNTTRFTFDIDTGNLTGTTFTGVATSARYADLAEKYSFAEGVEFDEGLLVLISEVDDYDCEISQEVCSDRVLGVFSEKPGLKMNADADGFYIALKGRVPAYIQGPVKKGEPLVSWVNGAVIGARNPLVQQYDKTGCIVGKSNANIVDESLQKVEIVVL